MELKPYPTKAIDLEDGTQLVISWATPEDVPDIRKALAALKAQEADVYDVVCSRMDVEAMAWAKGKWKDMYFLIGRVNGEIAGLANGRMRNDKVGISYHSVAVKRGAGIGTHMYGAKMEYHLEVMGQQEVEATPESPIGRRKLFEEWGLEQRTGLSGVDQHELGGAPMWICTQENYYKQKPTKILGKRIGEKAKAGKKK